MDTTARLLTDETNIDLAGHLPHTRPVRVRVRRGAEGADWQHDRVRFAGSSFPLATPGASPGSRFTLASRDSSPEILRATAEGLALPDGRSLRDLRSHYDAQTAGSADDVLTQLQGILHRIQDQTREMDGILTASLRRRGE